MRTKRIYLLTTVLLLLASCTRQKMIDNVIVVNVENNYPKKEYILQDIANVEYVKLENTEEFVTKGIVRSVSQNYIATFNGGRDGDIFLFDRSTGKAIRKFNHLGQGGEDYTMLTDIVLDEDNGEIFVIPYNARKIQVYNLLGDYIRTLKFEGESYYNFIYNYDEKHLIVYKGYSPQKETERSGHILISKKDGSVVRKFQHPYEEIATPVFSGMHEKYGEITLTPLHYLNLYADESWVLTRPSCDTIYSYKGYEEPRPYIIREPSIHSMDTQVFLYPVADMDNHCFMYTQKKEVDMKTFKGFPTTELVYDKMEKAIYESTVYNGDIIDGKPISMINEPRNNNVLFCISLEAVDLLELLQENKLKGSLKTIAETLDSEDNPVIMIVTLKK